MALTGAPSWENYEYVSRDEDCAYEGVVTVSKPTS